MRRERNFDISTVITVMMSNMLQAISITGEDWRGWNTETVGLLSLAGYIFLLAYYYQDLLLPYFMFMYRYFF